MCRAHQMHQKMQPSIGARQGLSQAAQVDPWSQDPDIIPIGFNRLKNAGELFLNSYIRAVAHVRACVNIIGEDPI